MIINVHVLYKIVKYAYIILILNLYNVLNVYKDIQPKIQIFVINVMLKIVIIAVSIIIVGNVIQIIH
jgi:hypothetical protein